MATDLHYTVQTQYPTVEFLGGTQTRDVVAVGIVTRGHGVYIEFRIPTKTYDAAAVKANATGYTGTVESQFAIPGVAGLSWGQSPDASGELQDQFTYTIVSTSGNSSQLLTVPIGHAGTPDTVAKIAKAVAEMDAAEGLTS